MANGHPRRSSRSVATRAGANIFQNYFWNRFQQLVNLDSGRVVLLGIAAMNLWHIIIQVRWMKKWNIWNSAKNWKSIASGDWRTLCIRMVSQTKRGTKHRGFCPKKHIWHLICICNCLNPQKCLSPLNQSNQAMIWGWDGNRSKLPGEATKRLKGEMCRGSDLDWFQ